jgi:hypothetical protein
VAGGAGGRVAGEPRPRWGVRAQGENRGRAREERGGERKRERGRGEGGELTSGIQIPAITVSKT